jgi:hypothetical protein
VTFAVLEEGSRLTQDKFTVTGDQLAGRGLSFDISALRSPKGRDARLVEIGEAIYLQGRESALLSHEDRFDLHGAVEALRALAVVVGPCLAGERHRRASDILARLLQEQRAV